MKLSQMPATFDGKLWVSLVDHVTVHADERVVFTFMDGSEVTTML